MKYVCESMAWQGPDASCGVTHSTEQAAENHAHRLNAGYRALARRPGGQGVITNVWRVRDLSEELANGQA
ncbi:MAG: hypothetical protein L0177_00500 [Chloroflexi bacterium]|nr:hypothetical protein [Chloroflexota bacterium]